MRPENIENVFHPNGFHAERSLGKRARGFPTRSAGKRGLPLENPPSPGTRPLGILGAEQKEGLRPRGVQDMHRPPVMAESPPSRFAEMGPQGNQLLQPPFSFLAETGNPRREDQAPLPRPKEHQGGPREPPIKCDDTPQGPSPWIRGRSSDQNIQGCFPGEAQLLEGLPQPDPGGGTRKEIGRWRKRGEGLLQGEAGQFPGTLRHPPGCGGRHALLPQQTGPWLPQLGPGKTHHPLQTEDLGKKSALPIPLEIQTQIKTLTPLPSQRPRALPSPPPDQRGNPRSQQGLESRETILQEPGDSMPSRLQGTRQRKSLHNIPQARKAKNEDPTHLGVLLERTSVFLPTRKRSHSWVFAGKGCSPGTPSSQRIQGSPL